MLFQIYMTFSFLTWSTNGRILKKVNAALFFFRCVKLQKLKRIFYGVIWCFLWLIICTILYESNISCWFLRLIFLSWSRSSPAAARPQKWPCAGTVSVSSASTSTSRASWQTWSRSDTRGRPAYVREAVWWRSARWRWRRWPTNRWSTCCAPPSPSRSSLSSRMRTELPEGISDPSYYQRPCLILTPVPCGSRSFSFFSWLLLCFETY